MSARSSLVLATCALVVILFSSYLLVSGSPLLNVAVSESMGLPLGNLTTWAGIFSLPIAVHCGFPRLLRHGSAFITALRMALRALIGAAAGWGLVAYALAGNWSFNYYETGDSFQGSAAAWSMFLYFSAAIVVSSLAIGLTLVVTKLIRR